MRKPIRLLSLLLILPIAGAVPAGLHEQAELLEVQALAAMENGEWRVAENRFRDMLDLLDANEDSELPLARCLVGLGKALVLQGESGESRALHERALRILRRMEESDSRLEAEALHGLARGALLEGKTGRARSFLMRELMRERALRDDRAEQEPLAFARTLRELGRLGDSRYFPGSAVSWVGDEAGLYERALREGRLVVPSFLDQVARDADRGDHAFRLSYLRAAAVSADDWPSDAAMADALRGVAQAYETDGQAVEASNWFEQAWETRPPSPFMRSLEAFFVFRSPKALALGLGSDGRWVFGFAVGSANEEEAVERALASCERRLPWYRVDAVCRLYALHDAVVWEPESGTSASMIFE